jgi:N-acyl-D-aspartate/D-glutamate deacylase
VELLGEISRENGVAVTFGLTESARRPDLYKRVIDVCEQQNARGARLRPQTTSRGIGVLFGIAHRTPYDRFPAWQALLGKPLAEKLDRLKRDRDALIAAVDTAGETMPAEQLFVLLPDDVTYHNDPERSLAAHARRRNEGPVAAFIDLALETGGRASCYYAFLNQNQNAVKEMLLNPTVAMGLADSGAHVGQIMDASQPSWLLSHWARDRKVISVEEAIRRWTSDTAAIFGVRERGVLREGMFADVNVIDLPALALEAPEYVHDFPGGAGRYIQKARGYSATLVNGSLFMKDGAPTGELRGRLLTSA